MNTRTTDDMINEIMNEFDFDKVQRTMKALNWKWASVSGVPTTGDIRRRARAQLREAVERKTRASSGGLVAEWNPHGLRLSFELASWYAETEIE